MKKKKIPFPLEMENGVKVRNLEELVESFSFSHVLMYISNGKLVTWLRDRYENDIADSIEKLELSDDELPKKICELFGVPYSEVMVEEIEKEKERNHKLELLRQYTSDPMYMQVIDRIAFNQHDLYNLLNENKNDIYLCGDTFSIPLAKKGIHYTGINNPTVIIDSNVEVDWNENGIYLSEVKFDDKYQTVVEHAIEAKKKAYYAHYKESYLSFMLTPEEKIASGKNCNNIFKEVENISYHYSDVNTKIPISSTLRPISPACCFMEAVRETSRIAPADKRNIAFELLIRNINLRIKKQTKLTKLMLSPEPSPESDCLNMSLALIYDYDKLNDYAKIIVQKSKILLTAGDNSAVDVWASRHTSRIGFKNLNVGVSAKDFVKYCLEPQNIAEGYKFIFWALMILTVDKTDAAEHLSLICDFARMLRIGDDEMEDIVYIIKIIFQKDSTAYVFKTTTVPYIFSRYLNYIRQLRSK